ncbi:hypothetical protein HK098_005111 [Nowakowskiella sp. JEL0407]|nr:hypothetical protein HK098_005111 [Nowakowskiella sp. JEL0407]
MTPMFELSSAAQANLSQPQNLLLAGLKLWIQDPFNENSNPDGILNLGTAENKVMGTRMSKKLNECLEVSKDCLLYGDFQGSFDLRTGITSLLNRHWNLSPKLAIEQLMLTNGCSNAISVLIQCLCDAGDGVLLAVPYYGGFDFDIKNASQAKIVPVFTNDPNLIPSVADFEKSYASATESGCNVKVMLLCNPYNPTGGIIAKDRLLELLNFAKEHKLHVISDEIYGLSVWNKTLTESEKWVSSYSLDLPDPQRTHMVWSFSKDFSMSGARCGIIVSRNEDIIRACLTYAHVTTVCNILDAGLAAMLKDTEWMDRFIKDNADALFSNHQLLTNAISTRKISFLKASGGFFLWADFGSYIDKALTLIKNGTKDGDMVKVDGIKRKVIPTEDAEEALFNLFCANGVYAARGAAFFHTERGWFRILFGLEPKHLNIAIERIFAVLDLL